eukprot:scaffold2780_cov174-Amphora_coffeaeformis.AAC.10
MAPHPKHPIACKRVYSAQFDDPSTEGPDKIPSAKRFCSASITKWTSNDFNTLFDDTPLSTKKKSSPTTDQDHNDNNTTKSVSADEAHWQDISPNRQNKLVQAAHRSHEASLKHIHAWDSFVGALQRHFDFMASGELSLTTKGRFHVDKKSDDPDTAVPDLLDKVDKATRKYSAPKTGTNNQKALTPATPTVSAPDACTSCDHTLANALNTGQSAATVPDRVLVTRMGMAHQNTFSVPNPLYSSIKPVPRSIAWTNGGNDTFVEKKDVPKMAEYDPEVTLSNTPLTYPQAGIVNSGDMSDSSSCDALLFYDEALPREQRVAWAGVDSMAVYAAIEGGPF